MVLSGHQNVGQNQ